MPQLRVAGYTVDFSGTGCLTDWSARWVIAHEATTFARWLLWEMFCLDNDSESTVTRGRGAAQSWRSAAGVTPTDREGRAHTPCQ